MKLIESVPLQEMTLSMVSNARVRNFFFASIKQLFSFKMLFLLLCSACCIVLDTLNQIPFLWHDRGEICTYYYIFNSLTFGGHYVPYCLPALAAAAYSVNAYQEIDSRMCGYIVQRLNLMSYVFVKSIVSAIGGAVVCSGGLMLFTAWSMIYQPFFSQEWVDEAAQFPYFSALSDGNGFKYLMIVLFLMAMTGIIWSLISLLCSTFFDSPYITVTCPLILCYLFTRLMVILQIPDSFRIDQLLHARSIFLSESLTLVLIAVFTLSIAVLSIYGFYVRLKKQLGEVI